MKSNLCHIGFEQSEYSAMLDEVEKAGKYAELSLKQTLQLRLLAEELTGMLENVTNGCEAIVWVETDDKSKKTFRVCAEAYTDMDADKRKALLKVASSGENEAYRGFMGKIRQMVEVGILGVEVPPMMYPVSMPAAYYGMETCSYYWEMNGPMGIADYERVSSERKPAAQDNFERSIVASIADNVLVGIKDDKAEIVIVKKFD